jgi:hypothetical protein
MPFTLALNENEMKNIYRALSIILLLASLIQMLGVGERILHGMWLWYKFNDYSDDGYTTISLFSVYLTYGLSFLLIAVGFFIFKMSTERLVSNIAMLSIFLLGSGLLALSAILASPIAQLASR